MAEHKYKLIFDTNLMRPACVLLQAIGGGESALLHRFFTSEDWLVSPTPDMKGLVGTLIEWERVAQITVEKRKVEKWKN